MFDKNNILKIADFGASKYYSNKMKELKGTPYYVAPEIINGEYNEKCDIWSLGVILYVLLSGYPPFGGEENDEIISNVVEGKYDFNPKPFNNVSDKGKDFIRKILIKKYKNRPNCSECLKDDWFGVDLEDKIISEDLMKNL